MTSTTVVTATVQQLKECLSKELPKLEKNKASNTPLSSKFYERCLDTLNRLTELPIDLPILSKTLVGTVVSKYKSCPDPDVAQAAKNLVKKWKALAKQEGLSNGATKLAPVPVVKQTAPMAKQAIAVAKRPSLTKKPVTKKPDNQVLTSNKFDSLPNLRKTICNKFFTLLVQGNTDVEVDEVAEKTLGVEYALENKYGSHSSQYKEKARSLIFNMKKNEALRQNIVSGDIEPKTLITMTPDQLVSSEKAAARAKIAADLADSRRLDWETANEDKINEMCGIKGELLSASLFTCGRCKSVKTTSTQKQTRSADEPMTVFVLCMNCGNRWKC